MREAFKWATANQTEIIIISDANDFYIDTIARAKSINGFISRTITNFSTFDDNGRLTISRHTIEEHGCAKCAANLCKGTSFNAGRELLQHMSTGQFKRVIYAGDGRNDFCPSTKLKEHDLVLVRMGRAFHKMLQDSANRSMITAKIIEWNTADDLFRILKSEYL